MSTVWRSSPLSEEELSELPECVLCERLVRRAERGVRSGARVPFPSRVAGHAQRCGQYGASRGGIRSQGEEGGERGRIRVALPAIDSLGIGRQGFGARRGLPRLSARQSDAFVGSRARNGSAHPLRSKDVRRRPANGTDLLPILIC